MKYSLPDHSEDPANNRKRKTLKANGGTPVYIYNDGTVEAEGFKDISKGGVDYEVDHKAGVVSFVEKTNDNLLVKYIPSSVKKVYEVISKKAYSLKNQFAKIIGKVKTYSVKDLLRYKHASKTLKDGIDKHLKTGKTFVFSTDYYAGRYIKPHIESTTFGPYEENVVLTVEKDINFINDLLVVKTGFASMGNNSIVYISPHKVLVSTGYHTSSGVNYLGNTTIVTGQNLDAGINSTTELHRVTSKDYIIKKGTTLKSTPDVGNYYYMADSSPNQLGQPFTDSFPVSESTARAYFSKYSNKMQSSFWDGVIPAGTSFSVECWSTSDKYIGYAGEISVVPVDETIKVDITGECSAAAEGSTYEEAKAKANSIGFKTVHAYKTHDGVVLFMPGRNTGEFYDWFWKTHSK